MGNNKLGSIGIAVRKGISFHGFALNVNPSLLHFEWINPCGLTDIGVTSLENELGETPPIENVRRALAHHLGTFFHPKLNRITKDKLNTLLSPHLHEEAPVVR